MRKSSKEAVVERNGEPAENMVVTCRALEESGTVMAETGARYGKEQILNSSRYRGQRDLVNALIEEGKQYSLEEVDGLLEEYLKGRVM